MRRYTEFSKGYYRRKQERWVNHKIKTACSILTLIHRSSGGGLTAAFGNAVIFSDDLFVW